MLRDTQLMEGRVRIRKRQADSRGQGSQPPLHVPHPQYDSVPSLPDAGRAREVTGKTHRWEGVMGSPRFHEPNDPAPGGKNRWPRRPRKPE